MELWSKQDYGDFRVYAFRCPHLRLWHKTVKFGQYHEAENNPNFIVCDCVNMEIERLARVSEALEKYAREKVAREKRQDQTQLVGETIQSATGDSWGEPPWIRAMREKYRIHYSMWVPLDGQHYSTFVGLVSGGVAITTVDRLAIEPTMELNVVFLEVTKDKIHNGEMLRLALLYPDYDFHVVMDCIRELYKYKGESKKEQRLLNDRMKAKPLIEALG